MDRSNIHALLAKPFAHRGLHRVGVPENSLAAINASVEAGFPIEIDVQVAADGCAIVFHDWNFARLAGLDENVADCDWDVVRGLRLCGTSERIPRLEEVLELVAGRVVLLIELKVHTSERTLERAVAPILTAYPGCFAVQSFNPASLGWFRRHYPGMMRGQLACSFNTASMPSWKKLILSCYGMNWMSAPHFLGHRIQDLPAPIPRLLRCFIPLIAWTVTSVPQAQRAAQFADNYIFEGFLPESDGM